MDMQVGKGPKSGRIGTLAVAAALLLAFLSFQVYWSVTGAHVSQDVNVANASAQRRYNGTITVAGTGQVKIQPDRAVIEVGVITQNATAEAAAARNAYLTNGLIAALEATGIGNGSIATASYSISQVYSCCGAQTVTGYAVSNMLEVTVLSPGGSLQLLGERVGSVIDTAVSHGANALYGIQFSASDQATAQAREQALQLAVRDASSQAMSIAQALGVNITGVVSVTTESLFYHGPAVFLSSSLSDGTPVLPPQSLTVSAAVTATYSIQ